MGPHLALSPWWQLCVLPESSWWTLTVMRWEWGFAERQNKEGAHRAALTNLFIKPSAFHLICLDMRLKPKKKRESTAEMSLLILVLIASCKWLFILQFIHQYLCCGGCSVDMSDSVPSVSSTLAQKRKKHAETSVTVWLAQTELCVCLNQNMITGFLVSKHPGLRSIIPHLLTHPLLWLSSAAPLHSGLSSTSHSTRITLFVRINNILKMSSSQRTSIQPGMAWTQRCFPVWS